MLDPLVVGFLIGFSAGAAAMWWYFHQTSLIRTREEWTVVQTERCAHKTWEPSCLACDAWADYCEEQGRSFEETWKGSDDVSGR